MKALHTSSFLLGLASGALILTLIFGGLRLLGAPSQSASQQGQGSSMSLDRMAERFGMTTSELQKELDSGKTIRDIAQEHGAQFGGRRGGSGAVLSASGSSLASSSSQTSSQ